MGAGGGAPGAVRLFPPLSRSGEALRHQPGKPPDIDILDLQRIEQAGQFGNTVGAEITATVAIGIVIALLDRILTYTNPGAAYGLAGSVLILLWTFFGSGTTSWSSRLIHGGLRYLEYGELPLVYESLHERRNLLKIASHLVDRIPISIPVYRYSKRGKWLLHEKTNACCVCPYIFCKPFGSFLCLP